MAELVNKKEILTSREAEVELRAATVVVVEELVEELKKRGKEVLSIEVDWFLWQFGEARLK